ncbi:MAG TPA: hypothetical protein PK280_06335 [Planctomycetota bacterium]|nr:hypothetical protein [Planctomycetota bacterium]
MNRTEDIRRDLQNVRNTTGEDEGAGPFALLTERDHPLVAAERLRARCRHPLTLAFCVAAPLLTLAAIRAMPVAEQLPELASLSRRALDFLAAFVALWPLAMVMGAAWRAAAATLAEGVEETAMQLVLTPLRKRTIAAAKVLPNVRPFLWGIFATLPLYLLAGGMEPFLFSNAMPSPFVLWPFRAPVGVMALLFGGPYEQTGLSPAGAAAGALMALTDLGLVWAAAHWGAGLAVRVNSLVVVVLRLLLRLILLATALAAYLILALLLGLAIFPAAQWMFGRGELLSTLLGTASMLWLWWLFPLRNATRRCLADFTWFDRLAMDPDDPSLRNSLRMAAWWWYDGRRA